MLDPDAAHSLLREIVEVDVDFAINGGHFVEEKRDEIISMLLDIVISHRAFRSAYYHGSHLALLQFSSCHVPQLRRIAAELPSIRGTAVHALAQLLGESYKPELIEILFGVDYSWSLRESLCVLRPLLERSEIASIIDRALQWDPNSLDDDDGETHQRIGILGCASRAYPLKLSMLSFSSGLRWWQNRKSGCWLRSSLNFQERKHPTK